MPKASKTCLYNVIFPVWFICYGIFFISPLLCLVILIGNFVIDALVFLAALFFCKIQKAESLDRKQILWTITKLWLCGFLADLLSVGIMFLFDHCSGFQTNFMFDPYQSPESFLLIVAALILGGLFVFLLDRYLALRKCPISTRNKFKIALVMGIATAPWLFLVPSTWFY